MNCLCGKEEAPSQSSAARYHSAIVVNNKPILRAKVVSAYTECPEGLSQSNIDDRERRDYDVSKPPEELGSSA